MKQDKKKKKKLKILIPIFSILFIIGIFLITYFIDTNRFYSGMMKYDDKYLIKTNFRVLNKEEVPSDINLDNLRNYVDKISFSGTEFLPMEKRGDYLYLDLNNLVNNRVIESDILYTFTKNNNNGEVINDCEYDTKTNIAKIPFSYYKDVEKSSPIQFELFSVISSKEMEELPLKTYIKNVYTQPKETKL